MAQEEKIFADGFVFKRNENAPEFVVGNISVKVEEAIAFLKQHEKKGWVNLSAKQARSGNYYMELDTFEAKKETPTKQQPTKKKVEEEDEDSPF